MTSRSDAPASGQKKPQGSERAPPQKGPDSHDKSSAGEEDPGAAIEEMRDPHPDARPARDKDSSER